MNLKNLIRKRLGSWHIIKELTSGPPKRDTMPDVFNSNNRSFKGSLEIAEGFNAFFTGIAHELK